MNNLLLLLRIINKFSQLFDNNSEFWKIWQDGLQKNDSLVVKTHIHIVIKSKYKELGDATKRMCTINNTNKNVVYSKLKTYKQS